MQELSHHWLTIQDTLFPLLEEKVGRLSENHKRLATAIDFSDVNKFIRTFYGCVGRPQEDRVALANSYIAKIVYKLPMTTSLIDRLKCDPVMRRLCGWESLSKIPSESTFSRAFTEFATTNLAQRAHEAFIKEHHEDRLICHISRDASAIKGREKAEITPTPKKVSKKRGRPKKGEIREAAPLTRLERQMRMTLTEMIADLPIRCDVGTKKNSKGYRETWKGYKIHIDTIDGDIPVSFITTSASLHDSQVALALSTMTSQRVSGLYELMDAAYDADIIRKHVTAQGRIPLIDFNHRSPEDQRSFAPHEAVRYKERSSAERVNSNLKDNYGGRFIRVRGHQKVSAHLAFGMLVMAIEQTLRLLT